ncbi:MAG: DUF1320 domain-containing protein [Methylophaga sp.]|nr:DUF1320 domain-containing protein [Methylophaga sp.]
MTYCTQQNLIDRYGNQELLLIIDRDQDGTLDSAIIDLAIADAAAEIDSYLATVYTLPLSSTPAVLTIYACDIARYRLYDDRTTDEVKDRYEKAIKWLTKVAEGKVTLGDTGGQDSDSSHATTVRQGVSKHDWESY